MAPNSEAATTTTSSSATAPTTRTSEEIAIQWQHGISHYRSAVRLVQRVDAVLHFEVPTLLVVGVVQWQNA